MTEPAYEKTFVRTTVSARMKLLPSLSVLWLVLLFTASLTAADRPKGDLRVIRFDTNPIIRPEMLPGRDGDNINGPSLIRVPPWLQNPLGKYYLYFANHHGKYIRLAYADQLAGPWKIYEPGTLRLEDAPGCQGHIASPDVVVDDARHEFRLYFHGPARATNAQKTFIALSKDGLSFKASAEVLGNFYWRVFQLDGWWYGMGKGGLLHRSKDGLTGFETGPNPFPGSELRDRNYNDPGPRHVALQPSGRSLWVYYSNIGDAPERILRARLDLAGDWKTWRTSAPEEVLRPELEWEGTNLPLKPSTAGAVKGKENALRDPAIFVEDGRVYLIYSIAGEAGLAIAEVKDKAVKSGSRIDAGRQGNIIACVKLSASLATFAAVVIATTPGSAVDAPRPNILWITSEDHGPHMGCYGDQFATTPNVDQLAAKGMIYTHAWSCAPVCAPARTILISGLYATSTGGEHMRSLVPHPAGKQMYPQLLRAAGYYCSNNAKEDYNLAKPGKVWDESSKQAHWRNRATGQPFFAVFNSEKSHESKIRARPHTPVHDPARVRVPAYHPDTPEVRHDWAQYYDIVSEADADAGKLLAQLDADGLTEDTIVFYFADHGSGMPRSKRWPYNSGLQVPLVVFIPEKFKALRPPDYKPGGQSDRLVSFVDFAPTLLSLAGVEPPPWMQGRAFLGRFIAAPNAFLHGFRGRMDERYDLVRSVTDGRYVYIRNYLPHLIYAQHLNYMWQTPTTGVWEKLHAEGKLTPAQDAFWNRKPPEELYDLQSDPDEVQNLATSPANSEIKEKLRQAQQEHALKIRDVGFIPEDERFSRAQGASPYDLGHDENLYPLKRVLATAELASMLSPDALPALKHAMADPDSTVRYWGVLGVLMRGKPAVTSARSELRVALKDSSTDVRIAAAQALGQFGSDADLKDALLLLADHANWKMHDVFSAMAALNSLDALGDKAAPLAAFIKTLPTTGPAPDNRYSPYVPRLLKDLGEKFK